MIRINVFLVLLIMVSALAVVTARQEARKSFQALQKEQEVGRDLEVAWERLLLKQASWAMYHKVEAIASQRLGMSSPDVSRIQVLRAETASSEGAVGASGGHPAGAGGAR